MLLGRRHAGPLVRSFNPSGWIRGRLAARAVPFCVREWEGDLKYVLLAGAVGLTLAGCGSDRLFNDRSELIYEPTACTEQRLDVYFDEGQARLTGPARQLIAMTGERLQGCHVDRVEVIGLASATGDARANQTLSERRAERVIAALRDAGWPTPEFVQTAAAGDAGALTESGLAEPMRRRAVVVVHARPQ